MKIIWKWGLCSRCCKASQAYHWGGGDGWFALGWCVINAAGHKHLYRALLLPSFLLLFHTLYNYINYLILLVHLFASQNTVVCNFFAHCRTSNSWLRIRQWILVPSDYRLFLVPKMTFILESIPQKWRLFWQRCPSIYSYLQTHSSNESIYMHQKEKCITLDDVCM